MSIHLKSPHLNKPNPLGFSSPTSSSSTSPPPMAVPSTIDDDDDDFKEYNPHPYQGGYDIALTYGHPLPPSPATCYPISGGSGHLPKAHPPSPPPESLPLPPPSESDHRPEPRSPPRIPPPPVSGKLPEPSTPLALPPPPSESDHRPEPRTPPPLPPPPESGHCPEPSPTPPPIESGHRPEYDYRPVNYWPWPDFDNFGFWPNRMTECGRCCAGEEGVSYWHQLKRAGDYIFGYSEGYGERRIGVDSYGIPIYANKKESSEVVTVEIEPARDLKVECYASGDSNGNWLSFYDDKNGRCGGYAYDKHYHVEPLHAQENLVEPMLHQQLTYHEVYEEKVYPKLEWWSSFCEEENKSYAYAHNKQCYEEALHVEENLAEPMLHQHVTYHEVYDELYPKLETCSSYSEHDDERNFYGNNQYAYERHDKEQSLCVELEPYKPTWSQNLHYVEFYGGELPHAYNNHSSIDNVVEDERNIFGDSNSAYTRSSYEQPVCVELEPYKSTWAQNPTFYESYGQEASQSSWADYSYKENGFQYFSSLFEYSQYDI